MQRIFFLTLGLVLWCFVLLTDTASAASVYLRAASPHLVGSDKPTKEFANRVTFTPDHDQRHDYAQLKITVPTGYSVRLEAYRWIAQKRWVPIYLSSWQATNKGHAQLRWYGKDGHKADVPDGSYLLTVCTRKTNRSVFERLFDEPQQTISAADSENAIEDEHDEDQPILSSRFAPAPDSLLRSFPLELSRTCLPKPVVAHVRRLSVGILEMGSIRPSQRVHLSVGSERRYLKLAIIPNVKANTAAAPLWQKTLDLSISKSFLMPDLSPGIYRLRALDMANNVRYLPLVVRSAQLNDPPAHTALIVWPYLTWRAYNRWDMNRDALPDTWYVRWQQDRVSLRSAYENYGGKGGDLPPGSENDYSNSRYFMNWLEKTPKQYQVITDIEFAHMNQTAIGHYRAIIFPGHTEYYTQAMYDKLRYYRNHGGHAVFLSANNFFRRVKVDYQRNQIIMVDSIARSASQSDFALIGVGFVACCFDPAWYAPSEFTRSGFANLSWFFAGTDLVPGSKLGHNGIEIDNTNPMMSPKSTIKVAIAPIPEVHQRAVMAYTRFGSSGEVWASGNMAFLRWLAPYRVELSQDTSVMLDNLWQHMVAN